MIQTGTIPRLVSSLRLGFQNISRQNPSSLFELGEPSFFLAHISPALEIPDVVQFAATCRFLFSLLVLDIEYLKFQQTIEFINSLSNEMPYSENKQILFALTTEGYLKYEHIFFREESENNVALRLKKILENKKMFPLICDQIKNGSLDFRTIVNAGIEQLDRLNHVLLVGGVEKKLWTIIELITAEEVTISCLKDPCIKEGLQKGCFSFHHVANANSEQLERMKHASIRRSLARGRLDIEAVLNASTQEFMQMKRL